MSTTDTISELLKISVQIVKKPMSMHDRQVLKMKAGKLRKVIKERNDESKRWRSGVKLDN